MPLEFIGLHFFADSSELHPINGVFDPAFVRDYAIAHEEAGFDRVLIGQTATWPDGIATAGHIASVTARLKFMIAHRPGFIQPTMAARMFATLDQLSQGRVGIHIITGASDIETQCDGDYLTKDERYHRSREYVDVLRAIWRDEAPQDHDGGYYRYRGGWTAVRPVQPAIPIFWGGNSDLAVRYGAECADVYAIGPDTIGATRAAIERIQGEARKHGRAPDISMSMRILLGSTEDEAWAKAATVLDAVADYQRKVGKLGRDKGPGDAGARQLMAMAARGERLDERLWTGITKATEGRMHATALVGTPRQVADALLGYYEAGVDRFLLNGFDTINDVRLMGETLLPLVRADVAARGERRAA